VNKVQGVTPKKVRLAHVLRALSEYTQEKWQKIGGYRPWTHWSFVRSLHDKEVPVLARELTKHIQEKGITDPMRAELKGACRNTCQISCRQPAGAASTFLACAQVCKVDQANPGPKPYKTCAKCACEDGKPVCKCEAPADKSKAAPAAMTPARDRPAPARP
jgi:hypothetical protein